MRALTAFIALPLLLAGCGNGVGKAATAKETPSAQPSTASSDSPGGLLRQLASDEEVYNLDHNKYLAFKGTPPPDLSKVKPPSGFTVGVVLPKAGTYCIALVDIQAKGAEYYLSEPQGIVPPGKVRSSVPLDCRQLAVALAH